MQTERTQSYVDFGLLKIMISLLFFVMCTSEGNFYSKYFIMKLANFRVLKIRNIYKEIEIALSLIELANAISTLAPLMYVHRYTDPNGHGYCYWSALYLIFAKNIGS